jgi:hypothetical protein
MTTRSDPHQDALRLLELEFRLGQRNKLDNYYRDTGEVGGSLDWGTGLGNKWRIAWKQTKVGSVLSQIAAGSAVVGTRTLSTMLGQKGQ